MNALGYVESNRSAGESASNQQSLTAAAVFMRLLDSLSSRSCSSAHRRNIAVHSGRTA